MLELGYQNKSDTGEPRSNGYEIELELPLFDFGSARVARAEATYMQAVHRTAQVAVNARSEVRESYSAYRTAYDLAKHYRDEVVPLRKRISEENLLRYNGMLIGVFELLADSRDQVASVTGYVEALRDFWVAETNLQTALTGRSPGARPHASAATASAAASGGRRTERDHHDQSQKLLQGRRRRRARRRGREPRRRRLAARGRHPDLADDAAAARARHRPALQPGGHAQRLVAALAHEQRRQGVPPGRRAGRARDRARHEGQPVGLQRLRARARPSRRSRATACASSSPTSCPSTPPCTGTASCCRRAWTAWAG